MSDSIKLLAWNHLSVQIRSVWRLLLEKWAIFDRSWPLGFPHNHFHNILRLFDVLPNFDTMRILTSDTMRDYYL